VDDSVARAQEGDESALSSELIDPSDLSLADLRTLADDDVAGALSRILRDIDQPTDAVAGFQSAI
jgi:FXSXX-COOH protein